MTVIEVRPPVSQQQLLWCTPGQSDAFSPRFVMGRALRITGRIDAAALRAALDDVVARHEMLRTIVVRDAQPPYQEIHPPLPVPLTVRELPTPAEARPQAAEDLLGEAEDSSIDVEQLPLLRATLTRFDDHDSVLSVVTHHSGCDGWSMNLILRDLVEFYAARIGERPLTLPDVLQYQDYVRWQLTELAQPRTAAKMAYWQDQLAGAQLFGLPGDHPVPARYTAPYYRHPFFIDRETTAAVHRFTRAERCSGFMVMLAAFNVLAHRISGTYDPTISTVFHGRSDPRFQDTLGMFMNFPIMRTDLSGCQSFRDVVLRTRATCLDALEHEVTLPQILQAIPSIGKALRHPVNAYSVFSYWDLTLTRATGEPYQIGEGATVIRRNSRSSEKLPGGTTWGMVATPSGEVSCGLQYNSEVFEEQTIAGWTADYCRIVAAAMADPNQNWQQL